MTDEERLRACTAAILAAKEKYGCEILASVLWEQTGTGAPQFRGATPKIVLVRDWKPEESKISEGEGSKNDAK